MPFKRKLLIAILAGVAICSSFVFFRNFKKANQNDSAVPIKNIDNSSEQEDINFEPPVRLKIPGINVDAPLRPVGLDSAGAMEAPKGPDDVVWFEPGPYPGEEGSAVIAGHYGHWKNGSGSVFDNLNKLSKGDKIYIEDGKGATITFVVRESRSYDPNADAGDVFDSNDGKSHLNLITCEGIWNKDSKSYSQRRVVFADKE